MKAVGPEGERVVGVIGAMAEEVEALVDAIDERDVLRRGPFTLYSGTLVGRRVIVAECGIGKVNAAALTQVLIDAGAGAVIFTGVAGAVEPSLRVGDIVVSTDAAQHDVDVTALGYALGEVPADGGAWSADPALVEAATAAARTAAAATSDERNRATHADGSPRVLVGRVVSGDQFIASPERVASLREAFGAACVEMEGAAVAQICAKWRVPFVIVRSISDTADHHAETDFRAFTRLAAARAVQVVRHMLERS